MDGRYEVEDSAGVVPRAGCEPNPDDPLGAERVYCTFPRRLRREARVYLGDRNDLAYLSEARGLAVRLFGGTGRDDLTAPGGGGGIPLWTTATLGTDEPLLPPAVGASSLRSRLSGGPGADNLWGSAGNDVLMPGVGRDIVQGFRGDDRVFARDGVRDDIECDAGGDYVVADRRDFVWGRSCRVVRRPGTVVAIPLGISNDYDGGYIVQIFVGCPSDSPLACEGTLTLSVRGGRRLLQRRFRITPGVPKLFEPYVSDAAGAALERRDALVAVRSVDSAGRMRTLSRVFDIGPLPEPD